MSDLYGQLSRLFQEVSPLPVAGKKRRAKKNTQPGLFAEASTLHKVQIGPGIYAERAMVSQTARPCVVVLDSPKPLLLLATTVDFTEAEFKFAAFQIPLKVGRSTEWNIDTAFFSALEGRRQMATFKALDQEIQELIVLCREAVKVGLSAEVLHESIEKLRVWSLEDYKKLRFLKSVVTTVMGLSDALYAKGTGLPAVDAAKKQVAAVRKELKAVELALKMTVGPESGMLEALVGLVPDMRSNRAWIATLKGFLHTPTDEQSRLINEKTLVLGGWEGYSTKNLGNTMFWLNEAYLTFVDTQIKG